MASNAIFSFLINIFAILPLHLPLPRCSVAVESSYTSSSITGRRTRNTNVGTITNAIEEFDNEALMPRFAEPIPNVTVTAGRDALLACVVENLRGYKVAWVRVDTQTILSIHHNIITQNPRISLSYNDHRSWYLHIRNVQEADRGWYMCQINTDPMRSRQGYLQVVVPPTIIDSETSTDMIIRESTNVTMYCKATGYPEPYVMWRREDGEDINYNGELVNVVDGEMLHIIKVSRLHMGAYLCIASNGVPPSISKRIQLKVQFPPMLSISNQLEYAYIGQDVSIECRTEAHPASINYWTTEKGDMIVSDMLVSGEKYEAVSVDNGYNKYMMLKIKNVTKSDFGTYKCVAKNSLGETDGPIKIEQNMTPTTATSAPAKINTNDLELSEENNGKNRIQQKELGDELISLIGNSRVSKVSCNWCLGSAMFAIVIFLQQSTCRWNSIMFSIILFANTSTILYYR